MSTLKSQNIEHFEHSLCPSGSGGRDDGGVEPESGGGGAVRRREAVGRHRGQEHGREQVTELQGL